MKSLIPLKAIGLFIFTGMVLILIMSGISCTKTGIIPDTDTTGSAANYISPIVYTNPRHYPVIGGITFTTSYGLDLNNDGLVDFNISVVNDSFPCDINTGREMLMQISPESGNYVYSDGSLPFALDTPTVLIDQSATWTSAMNQVFIHNVLVTAPPSTTPPGPPANPPPVRRHPPRQMPFDHSTGIVVNGTPCNDITVGYWNLFPGTYAGLRITSKGKTYFGWVQLYIDRSSGTLTIGDYAYNSNAGEGIYAGQAK